MDPAVAASTRFFMQTVPSADGGAFQLYVGIDESFRDLRPVVELQRGDWFSSPRADEAVVGYNVADYHRLRLGDELQVQGRRIVVRGVLDKLGTQDDGTIFLPLEVGQALFDRRDRLTGVGVRLHDIAQAGAFIDRLYELPSVQVIRMSQVQSTVLGIIGGIRYLLFSFAGLCLIVALMGVVNVALIAAHERTAEMGVLRAMGCSAGVLFLLVWSETLLLGLAGAGGGALLSFALRGVVEWALRSTLAFVPSGTVVAVTPAILAASCGLVVALCSLGGLYPAWRSARVSPMTSMRGAA
jgi:putative ABC transport system permease protein